MSFIESETNNQFINTDPAIHQLNNPFPPLNSFSGTGENFTNKLDQVWTAVNTEINDFLQLPDWEVKTRLAITGDWLANEAQDFFSYVSPENINVEILPANDMPGIAGGYDAITGKIYLSENLVKYSDTAKIAEVLIEEFGHKADDILNPGQDSPGDEGEILAKLISNQGSIPADWQVLKQENDHKFIQVGDSWIGVEASENIKELSFIWSLEDVNDMTIDRQGNLYFSGKTNRNLGGVNAGSDGSSDVWVAKYNTQGEQLWIRQFGGNGWDSANGIEVDEQGNIYLIGSGDLGGVNSGSWIAKYNTQGEQLWIQPSFGSWSDPANDIEIDGQGNIYLTGTTWDNLDGVNAGDYDSWVAKYNTQGEKLWIQQFGSGSNEYTSGIELDTLGNIYLTGYTEGDLGGVNSGNDDAWVAKYNTQGEQLWIQQFGTQSSDLAYGIEIDGQGNIYLAGETQGDLGGVNAGYNDAWVAKYNTQGEQLWIQQFGSQSFDSARDIAIDGQDNIYLTGRANSYANVWIAKFTEGKQLWIQQIDGWDADFNSSNVIKVDGQGNIYLTNETYWYVAKYTQDIPAPVIPNIAIQDVAIVEDNAGQKKATFNITLDQITDQTVTVNYATVNNTAIAGSDFVDQIGQIVFAPGVQTQTITVPIIGDTVVEANETFFVQLSEPSNGVITTAQATGTITNDDQEIIVLPNISIGDVSISEGNSGQKNANFKVTLDKVSEKAVTVQYTTVDNTAKAGKDFVKKTGQITFNPGVKTQTISVPIIGDTVFEPNEKFTVKLSQVSNGKITKVNGIGTITNDDKKVVVLPNISIQDVRITEGNSGRKNANFKVTLDKVSNQTVTVQYTTVDDTAKASQDFVKKTGKLTFKPGVKSQTIAVPIIGDTRLEPNEKFSVRLSQPSNSKITKANGIGTITNDDRGDVTPSIPLTDKEPDNNTISNKLPTFSNLSEKPIEVLGKIGVLAGSQRDQNDYYRLILDQSENDLFVMLDGLQRDANIEILDRDGSTKLLSSTETDKTVDTISAILPAGTYYLRVYPKSSNATPYRLSVNV